MPRSVWIRLAAAMLKRSHKFGGPSRPSQKPLPWLPWQRENITDLKKWVNLNQSSLALGTAKINIAGGIWWNHSTVRFKKPRTRDDQRRPETTRDEQSFILNTAEFIGWDLRVIIANLKDCLLGVLKDGQKGSTVACTWKLQATACYSCAKQFNCRTKSFQNLHCLTELPQTT